MKQAKDEAKEEIEKYRAERERQFKEYEAKRMGRKEDIAVKIDENTEKIIADMDAKVAEFREPVCIRCIQSVRKLYYNMF